MALKMNFLWDKKKQQQQTYGMFYGARLSDADNGVRSSCIDLGFVDLFSLEDWFFHDKSTGVSWESQGRDAIDCWGLLSLSSFAALWLHFPSFSPIHWEASSGLPRQWWQEKRGPLCILSFFSRAVLGQDQCVCHEKPISEFADGTTGTILLPAAVCHGAWSSLNYIQRSQLFMICFPQISWIHVVELFGFVLMYLANSLLCQCEMFWLRNLLRG